MEAEQTMLKDKVLTPETRIPEMITREEIDSRFAQLRKPNVDFATRTTSAPFSIPGSGKMLSSSQ